MTDKKSILLIIGGGIAAYKCLELIRRLKEQDISVTPVLTKAGTEFVTPLSLATLAETEVHTDLFDLKNETEIGHIQLSRQADLVVVAPATADLMAKMANGLANDLASTLLLATDKDVLIAPAMNVRMWQHPATQRNIDTLKQDGVKFVGPEIGDMACGETGPGRLSEVPDIVTAIQSAIHMKKGPLSGKSILITAGPTHEPIDPVRYIANRSSGKQGYALAEVASVLGADVTLISGPTKLPVPSGIRFIEVETAREMRDATLANLPVDIAICAAAVADWRVKKSAGQKMKKTKEGLPQLELAENPDILANLSDLKDKRPSLVIGFAAETETVIEHAQKKLKKKGCDWIVANDVSAKGNVFGNDETSIHIISAKTVESFENVSKEDAAKQILLKAAKELKL
ncbi:MAG: bifunctional phosphopantothenoylcysteine decarboxylase/phosphopantothenate--cysteine ligase CoaBC [Rhizobiales bacterium]|nr:bifunctional phosphopantothenoylcysteine decarboxylase/phosphopantothenate--cysteine ligase CoaBC [Hyphomicrobiales bacterium]